MAPFFLISFGNFVNRVLTFAAKNYEGIVPDGGDPGGPVSPNDAVDADFVSDVNAILQQYIDALDAVKLRLGLQHIMQLSSRGNLYLQSSGLNTALKKGNPERCAQVIARAINLIYLLSVLVEPYMPATGAAMLQQLNAPQRSVPEVFSIDILPGHKLGPPAHLFKPIKEEMAEVWKQKFAGSKKDEAAGLPAEAAGQPGVAASGKLSKKQAAKAKKAELEYSGPKTPEIIALETTIAKQGELVRSLKSVSGRSKEQETELSAAISELKKLKEDMGSEFKKLQGLVA